MAGTLPRALGGKLSTTRRAPRRNENHPEEATTCETKKRRYSMSTPVKNVGKLQISTPSDREIAMTRAFDAPRSMVFDAWTKPELLKRWLGVFGNWSFAVCEVDLRVGGKYRYVWRGKDGKEMAMGGVFRQIVRPERLVVT